MIVMSDELEPRKPSDAEKIQAPSLSEIRDGLWSHLHTVGRIVAGRPLTKGELLNSLVTWFLLQTMEDRVDAIGKGWKKYDAILKRETSLASDPETTGARVPAPRETGSPKRPNKSKTAG